MMKSLRLLLFPFSVLYHAVTAIRNRLYDQGIKPSASFEVPVVSVGNLSVGGTGKTPMIEHLVRLLGDQYKVATLSRGYGRSTRGIRIASDADNASTLGDEPYQFYKKFGNKICVTVGEERALAISYLLHERPEINAVLLDDAFQHRRVKSHFQILLTEYQHPFYCDLILPAGNLRESKSGAARADVVVVTKCPMELSDEEMMEMETRIRAYSGKPVFFSGLHYGEMIPVVANAFERDKVVLVTGIANPESLARHVQDNYRFIKHFKFPDHHRYSHADIEKLIAFARDHQAMIITTEKDAMKFGAPDFKSILTGTSLFYLPIEIEFLKSGRDFDEMVKTAVDKYATI